MGMQLGVECLPSTPGAPVSIWQTGSKKSKQKTKGHTTKKAFTKKTKFQKNYAILSYLVSQMFPFNIPLIKVSLKYVGEKGKEKKIRQFTWEAEASRTLSWKPDWPSQWVLGLPELHS